MRAWTWQWQGHPLNQYCFSRVEPTRAAEDEPLGRIKAGQLLANMGCPCVTLPDDLLPQLPPPGEPRHVDVLELWEAAKLLPSYERQTWDNLYMMLGG